MRSISGKEAKIIYEALVKNEGHTLCPDWEPIKQKHLSCALDKLRSVLLDCFELPVPRFSGNPPDHIGGKVVAALIQPRFNEIKDI